MTLRAAAHGAKHAVALSSQALQAHSTAMAR